MTLSSSTPVGPYEVVAPLGAGGTDDEVPGSRVPSGATLASRLLAVSRDGSRIYAAQAVDQPDTNLIRAKLGASQ